MFTSIIEFSLEELKKEVGKYILCQSKEEGATRLFIHRFSDYYSATTKNGWWDTFTVTQKPCQEGYHICTIDDAKIDKNGHLLIVASPVKYLRDTVDQDNVAWRYLFGTGKFSNRYSTSSVCFGNYNPENVHEAYKYSDEFKSSGKDIYQFILSTFLDNKVSLEEIEKLLTMGSPMERLAEELIVNRYIYSRECPLLLAKMPKHERIMSSDKYYNVEEVAKYLTRKDEEYDKLGLGTEIRILLRVEAVLKHWNNLREKEKEMKRQARKNKK